MIDTDAALTKFLPQLQAAEWIAVDTEADSLHAYPEKLCLLQISLPGADVLIDPLAAIKLAPLWSAWAGRELIFHAADYDLRLLREHHGLVPHSIFDTMLAARLLGCERFGLSDLVQQFLGVTLEKGPQKADWARRPLTPRMEDYARNDTRHLHPIATALRGQLSAKGRLEWLQESCARLVAECSVVPTPDPEREWRLKGSAKLGRPALTILRALWHWREHEATRANRPPFFILSHDTLIALAATAAQGEPCAQLLPPRMSPRRKDGACEAVTKGLAVPPREHPPILRGTPYHASESERRRFADLRQRRDRRATALALDPTLIASKQTLELLARHGSRPEEILMRWQAKLLFEN